MAIFSDTGEDSLFSIQVSLYTRLFRSVDLYLGDILKWQAIVMTLWRDYNVYLWPKYLDSFVLAQNGWSS